MKAVFRPSRRRLLVPLFVSLAFVAAGFVILHAPLPDGDNPTQRHWVAWSAILLFGIFAVALLRGFIDSRPRLVIDARGVFDRNLRVGFIPWDQIEGAYLRSVSGNAFLCLQLRDPQPFLQAKGKAGRALAKANAALGFTPVSLNIGTLNAAPERVLQLIQAGIRRRESKDGQEHSRRESAPAPSDALR